MAVQTRTDDLREGFPPALIPPEGPTRSRSPGDAANLYPASRVEPRALSGGWHQTDGVLAAPLPSSSQHEVCRRRLKTDPLSNSPVGKGSVFDRHWTKLRGILPPRERRACAAALRRFSGQACRAECPRRVPREELRAEFLARNSGRWGPPANPRRMSDKRIGIYPGRPPRLLEPGRFSGGQDRLGQCRPRPRVVDPARHQVGAVRVRRWGAVSPGSSSGSWPRSPTTAPADEVER